MHVRYWRLAAGFLVISTLAGCGGGGGSGGGTVNNPPATRLQEDQFGVSFGAAFRVDANGTQVTPADGDIIPVSLTADPVNLQ